MTAKSTDPRRVEIVRHYFSRLNPLKGGVCVYATHTKGDSFIMVSTAICAAGDQYSKKTGVLYATPLYSGASPYSGNSIALPIITSYYNKNKFTRDDLLWTVEYYFGDTLGERFLDGALDNGY